VDKHPLVAPMHAQRELLWFVLVSALDIFATYILLRDGNFTESNPVAQYFFNRWGMKGMIYFKMGMVAFICIVAHVVSLQRPEWATRILQFATIVVAFVVIYSIVLLVRHGRLLRGAVNLETDLGWNGCLASAWV
jgi:hypothetical protein